jgi:hypothetical protein
MKPNINKGLIVRLYPKGINAIAPPNLRIDNVVYFQHSLQITVQTAFPVDPLPVVVFQRVVPVDPQPLF